MDKRFDDIRFLPKRLFTRHYPFIKGKTITHIPDAFTVGIDNPELWEWFSEVSKLSAPLTAKDSTILPNNDSVTKVKEIVNMLHGNLGHFVSFKTHQSVDVPFVDDRTCDCILCRHRDFKFQSVLASLDNTRQVEISLKQAYAHYVTGQLHTAVDILKKVLVEASRNNKLLTYAIANFNLSKLGQLLEYETHRGDEIAGLIAELKDTDMAQVYEVAGSSMNSDIIAYLKNGDFVKNAHRKTQELVNKIRDDYHEGNSGWNDQTRYLLETYKETVGFIKQNYIMYDSFYEFSQLSKLFIEGILASYACKDTLGGKLIHIDESIAEKMVLYGNHEDIRKLANRYKIKTIAFNAGNDDFAFVRRFLNLLQEYDQVVEQFVSFDPEGTGIFWSHYRRYFQNSLTLAALLDISKNDLRAIADDLLVFLKKEKHFQEYELTKTLRYFLFKKYEMLTDEQIKDFMLFGYTSDSISRENLTETLNIIATKKDLKLDVSELQWQELQNSYLINEEIEGPQSTFDLICKLYDVLPQEKQRTEIRNFVLHYLRSKFVADIYYTASMFDIITPKKKWSTKYLENISEILDKGKAPRLFKQKNFYTDHRLDEYINFAFKYHIAIDDEMKIRLAEMDDYYDWLLNLDNFDYQKFNEDWLFHHYTKHYVSHFRSSLKLKEYLRQTSKTSENLQVLRFYIDVFDN